MTNRKASCNVTHWPNVERDDADGVSCDDEDVVALVVEDEGEHSVDEDLGQEVRTVFFVEMEEDLAVGVGRELHLGSGPLQLQSQTTCVIEVGRRAGFESQRPNSLGVSPMKVYKLVYTSVF